MTRVLQIRRGTTANNNAFTGMPGEITMDTENKTLRIHDGETLGGFEMARRDDIKNSEFDITSVPDEIWHDIIARCAPTSLVMTETRQARINSKTAYLNYVVGIDTMPKIVQTILVCQNSEAGYNPGDEVIAFGIGNRCNPMPNITMEQGGLNLYLMVGNEKYWVSHKTNGTTTQITDENWNILFRVYC